MDVSLSEFRELVMDRDRIGGWVPWLVDPGNPDPNAFFLAQGAGPCWLRYSDARGEMFCQGTHSGIQRSTGL